MRLPSAVVFGIHIYTTWCYSNIKYKRRYNNIVTLKTAPVRAANQYLSHGVSRQYCKLIDGGFVPIGAAVERALFREHIRTASDVYNI